MTSLIDVIFLLLLFFMLTATFSRFGDVELITGGGNASTSDVVSPVFVQLGGELLTLNGEAVAWSDLGPELATIRTLGQADMVIVAVSEDANAQQLVDLIGIVNAFGDMPLQIVR